MSQIKPEGKFFKVMIGNQFHDTSWGYSERDVRFAYQKAMNDREKKLLRILPLR